MGGNEAQQQGEDGGIRGTVENGNSTETGNRINETEDIGGNDDGGHPAGIKDKAITIAVARGMIKFKVNPMNYLDTYNVECGISPTIQQAEVSKTQTAKTK